ncbi:MAG: ABC transporter substrate-binding protein [bacterium]|nr:ABC transporter substrate-binding protein [bacterium]
MFKKSLFTASFVVIFFAALVALNSYAIAATPTETLKMTIERTQKVFNDPVLSDEIKKNQVKKIAFGQFDFPEMSKRVLARHWSKIDLVEQKAFVDVFTELLERVYFNQIKLIRDANFSYIGERVEGNFAIVRSKIVTAKGVEFEIEYHLFLINNAWKIYDIEIEGISLAANYRAQFNKILSRNTFNELLQKMREKTQ